MRVLWGEIRKLLWWRNLLIVLAVGAIYYWVMASSMVDMFPNGHPMAEEHQYALEWRDEFGPALEPSEAAVIRERLAQLVAEADAIVAADPTLAAEQVRTWRDTRIGPELSSEANDVVWEKLLHDGGVGWKIEAVEGSLELYQPLAMPLEPVQARRIQQVNANEEWHAIQSQPLLSFADEYVWALSGLVFLVGLLVAAPLVTADRVSGVRQLQATSTVGRRLLRAQLVASCLVSVAITVVVLGVAVVPVRGFGFGAFWTTGIQSFMAVELFPRVTLGEYCGLMIGLLIIIGLLGALIGFVLSRLNRAYPALAITVMVALAVGLPSIMLLADRPLSYTAPLNAIAATPFSQPIAVGLLVGLAFLMAVVQVRRELTVDIHE